MNGLVATTRVHRSANRNDVLEFLYSTVETCQYAVSYWLAA